MSGGCYRCGLADGSSDRLCETCFRMKYFRGRDVIDLPPDVPVEGLEFSPKMRTFLLGSGAAFYASLVGFVMAAHVLHAKTHGDPRLEFVSNDQPRSIVTVEHALAAVPGPATLEGLHGKVRANG